MEPILKVDHLTKKYGNTTVVKDFSFEIKKGHIYGLIGPNGAGKTTIMKMVAGIAKPTSGSIALFGSADKIDESRSRMSFMIEQPYIDGSMTAKENLMYIRYLRGVADETRIEETLEFVGLNDTGKKIARQFSLGMKQRLGIAMALLSSPELMILDEPVNGLDPEGIVEIRKLLLDLCNKRGITILISSHILSELAELCTDFIIMDQGELVEYLSKEELQSNCRNYIAVSSDDNEVLTTVLEQNLGISQYRVVDKNEIHVYEMLDDIAALSKTITNAGLILTKLNTQGESLEEYYLSKVSKETEESKQNKNGYFINFKRAKGGK